MEWLGSDLATARGIGRYLEYTLLRPEATAAEVGRLCDEAAALGVRAVCVNGAWVPTSVERLRGTGVAVVGVVGFPLGAAAPAVKAVEARLGAVDGAEELDMVMALGAARAGDWAAVADEVRMVVGAVPGVAVKVIVETAIFGPPEIERACRVAREAGARFVKTSTGFHPAGGATVEAVRVMRRAVGPEFGVKAAGGIRTPEAALAMLAAGANRIGASNLAGLRGILGPDAPPLVDLLRRAGGGGAA